MLYLKGKTGLIVSVFSTEPSKASGGAAVRLHSSVSETESGCVAQADLEISFAERIYFIFIYVCVCVCLCVCMFVNVYVCMCVCL